jgi:hypothetical protein
MIKRAIKKIVGKRFKSHHPADLVICLMIFLGCFGVVYRSGKENRYLLIKE